MPVFTREFLLTGSVTTRSVVKMVVLFMRLRRCNDAEKEDCDECEEDLGDLYLHCRRQQSF
ncbi:MAG: hypothetical protein LZF86_80071 [Nitrospira sp.]|nr:MAG: hypothetical protein LZF86_80071 [Nitrospira sp.]